MFKLELKLISALIGISLMIMVVSGALLNYLDNPLWIGFFLGTIILVGIFANFLYYIFLWQFIEQRQSLKIIELEKELERLRR